MNPEQHTFCLLSNSKQSVNIQVQIKGTPPWTVDYERLSFDGSLHVFENVTIGESLLIDDETSESIPKKKIGVRKVYLLDLTVDQVGIYKILRIREPNSPTNTIGKVLNSYTRIVTCPTFNWRYPFNEDDKSPINQCVKSLISFSLVVKGTPPLKVWYLKRAGNQESTVSVDANFDSSLEDSSISANFNHLKEKGLTVDQINLIIQNQPQEIVIPIVYNLDLPQSYLFRLVKVSDGVGNTVGFYPEDNKSGSHSLPNPLYAKSSQIRIPKNGDQFFVDSHPFPQATFFRGCDSLKIKRGVDSSIEIPLSLEGSSPFKLTMARFDKLEDVGDPTKGEDFEEDDIVSDRIFGVQVSKPGVYVIRKVKDQHCETVVDSSQTCLVTETIPPTLKVGPASTIEKSCVGTIGTELELTLTGEPPFWLEMTQNIDETGDIIVTREDISNYRHTLELKPAHEGTYRYKITKIGDLNYRKGVTIDTEEIVQIIHPQSNAFFVSKKNQLDQDHFVRCSGDNVEANVKLTGTGPWTLLYEVIFENTKTDYKVENISKSPLKIITPNLFSGGTYIVALSKITDGNGCSWNLESPTISIQVLPQRPMVSFTGLGDQSIPYLEGQLAELPIELVGSGPFKFAYKDPNGKIISMTKPYSGKSSIDVSISGKYELLSLSDSHCSGTVSSSHNFCQASVIEKPRITLEQTNNLLLGPGQVYEMDRVCEGTPMSIHFNMVGKAPFKYFYTKTVEKDGLVVSNKFEEIVGGTKSKLILSTEEKGKYTYALDQISDDNYRAPILLQSTIKNHGNKIEIKQFVLGKPDARLLGGPDINFRCSGEPPLDQISNFDDNATNSVWIEFQGSPPFDLVLEIKHEASPKEVVHLKNITETKYKYQSDFISLNGKYKLNLVQVTDFTGCTRIIDRDFNSNTPTAEKKKGKTVSSQSPGFGPTSVNIHVSDVARLVPVHSPANVCVGEILSYSLLGQPPFKVFYSFDGVMEEATTVFESLFSVFVDRPGVLKIHQVCNNLDCCTRPEVLETRVWDLPRALVDGGDNVEESINEGDETAISVKFVGSPPFGFTYRRTSMLDDSSESFTLKGIDDHEYTIRTSQDGWFQVIAVYDRFCGYPRIHQDSQEANAKNNF